MMDVDIDSSIDSTEELKLLLYGMPHIDNDLLKKLLFVENDLSKLR